MASQPLFSRRRIGTLLATAAVWLWVSGGLAPVLAVEKYSLPDFMLRSRNREDGLPVADVQAVGRTPDGYVWVGTSRGLARFDGVRFVTLTTNNTPNLGDDRITCLLVTGAGELWIGTEAGVSIRATSGAFERGPEAFRGRRINALEQEQDAAGAIWVATRGSGVARKREAGWEFFSRTNGLPADGVAQIVADKQGLVWAISDRRHLVVFQDGRWQRAGELATVRQPVVAVARARGGGIWVGTTADNGGEKGGRIYRIRDRSLVGESTPYPWPQETFHTRLRMLFEDSVGRLWVGLATAGIYYHNVGLPWQALAPQDTFSQILVNCLTEDKSGCVWAGFDGAQLDQIQPRLVQTLNLPRHASQQVIRMACARRDGSVWVGTDGAGVFRYQNQQWTQYDAEAGLANSYIGVILEDSRTNLWVGTWNGLYRLQGNRFLPELEPARPPLIVRALHEDRQNHLWVGTSAGVLRLDGAGQVRKYAGADGYSGAELLAIEEDAAGTIWVATSANGLFRLNGDHFDRYFSDPWTDRIPISSLLADPAGGLWIGTMDRGVAFLKDGETTFWTSQDGLPSDMILSLIEDQAGDLWWATDNGITGSTKARLKSYHRGVSPPLLCWQLSVDEGLHSRRCSGAGQPVMSRSLNGQLWFPNSHALAVFNPNELSQAGTIYPPRVENVVVDGENVSLTAAPSVRISSTARRYEFHYSSPTLGVAERLRFRVQLAGFDPGWVEADRQRAAYYGRLPPGDYEFKVMAGSPAGIWQESLASVPLQVVPQLWERRMIRVTGAGLLIVVVAASVWRFERNRSRRRLQLAEAQQAMERERRRIARDLHDDLGSDLTEIMLLGERASAPGAPTEAVRSHTEAIAARSRQASAAMDEIVWTVNPRNDSVPRLADRVGERARRLFESQPVSLRVEIMEDIPALPLPAVARHNLFLTAKEAQNNVAKHSGATEVKVAVWCEPGRLIVSVEDNGTGFDPAALSGSRNGLENMRQRMESIGGTLSVVSAPGKGTKVRLDYPLPGTE
jgi:ligand-binding sensor domain-containing protein/signal transduction histidine kinase